jgi:hypothetical protein
MECRSNNTAVCRDISNKRVRKSGMPNIIAGIDAHGCLSHPPPLGVRKAVAGILARIRGDAQLGSGIREQAW